MATLIGVSVDDKTLKRLERLRDKLQRPGLRKTTTTEAARVVLLVGLDVCGDAYKTCRKCQHRDHAGGVCDCACHDR